MSNELLYCWIIPSEGGIVLLALLCLIEYHISKTFSKNKVSMEDLTSYHIILMGLLRSVNATGVAIV